MAAEQPTVSVIVPVCDVEAYLEECIDSVLEQTHALLEVILVDDGSTDGSGLLCDAFADRDFRVRVIHQPNAGLSAARNAGLATASGDYVTFLDGDDWWDPTFVSSLLAALEAHQGAGIAMSTFARVPGAAWVPPVGGTRLLSPGEAIDARAAAGCRPRGRAAGDRPARRRERPCGSVGDRPVLAQADAAHRAAAVLRSLAGSRRAG